MEREDIKFTFKHKFVDHLELLSHFLKNLLSNSTIIAIDPLFYVTSYYLKRVKLKNSKIFTYLSVLKMSFQKILR